MFQASQLVIGLDILFHLLLTHLKGVHVALLCGRGNPASTQPPCCAGDVATPTRPAMNCQHLHVHTYIYVSETYRPYAIDVTIEICPDNTAILSGKKIACFYTISETQAARNLYFQYVNYQ